jgi:hypothetical protein
MAASYQDGLVPRPVLPFLLVRILLAFGVFRILLGDVWEVVVAMAVRTLGEGFGEEMSCSGMLLLLFGCILWIEGMNDGVSFVLTCR